MLNLTLSKKQQRLLEDIVSPNKEEIYVLGSTQSGKTFDICLATLLYAKALYEYNPNEKYLGSITAWSLETLKGNILEPLKNFLDGMGLVKDKDYILKWQSEDKYLEIYNIRFYFFGFNNVLAFNKILGKPLIFEWIDESARIYSNNNLQQPFDEFPGRQVSYANHPYLKTIHSFNVEGNENHPYKKKYIDGKLDRIHYSFYPYDNPKLNTEEAIRKVINMFPSGSLREQKIYNKWVVASGRVFNKIPIVNNIDDYIIRDIVISIDYGSVHATVFVASALCWNKKTNQWKVFRIDTFYYDPIREGTTPTTEFFSNQLKTFIMYLKQKYPNAKITNIPIDSAAAHFHNRLITDNIPHELVNKNSITVNEGIELMQSLFEKEYLILFKMNSIRYFTNDGKPIFSGKDEGLIELESYQYDKIKSMNTGQNVFKKEFDDFVDAFRYGCMVLRDTGRIPNV